MSGIKIEGFDPFAGKNVTFCEGSGPDDPKRLKKRENEKFKMIVGHICGAGVSMHGTCQAVFADPEEHPELFENDGF